MSMTLVTAFLPDDESDPALGLLDLPPLVLGVAPSAPSAPASVFSLEE